MTIMRLSRRGKLRLISISALALAGCHDFSPGAGGESSGGSASGSAASARSGVSENAGAGGQGDGGSAAEGGASGNGDGGHGPAPPTGTSGQVSAGETGATTAGGGARGDLGGARQGAGGEPDEPPFCETGPGGHPVIGVTGSTDISNALTAAGNPFVLFMTQPTTSVLSITWNVGSNWIPWSCFDTVSHAMRVAAGNGGDSNLQVYALSDTGALWVRQLLGSSYQPWRSIDLPVGVVAAADIALRPGVLYLAASQGVFRRKRVEDESAASAPAWSQILEQPSTRVAALVNQEGATVVATLDGDGRLTASTESLSSPGEFSSPEGWDFPKPFADIDFGFDSLGQPTMFAATSDGSLATRTESNFSWKDWVEAADAKTARHLRSVSVHSQAPSPPYVFGIGDYDLPIMSSDGGHTWTQRF